MGSSKETTGFPQGTQWLPMGFTVIPSIGLNEKDKVMTLTHKGRDLIQINQFLCMSVVYFLNKYLEESEILLIFAETLDLCRIEI